MPDESCAGHRGRLRERFLHDPEALPDYELLELLLGGVIPRSDTKPLAKRLIKTFGSFQDVLFAETEHLLGTEGVGPACAAQIRAVHEASVRMARKAVLNKPVLDSGDAVVEYCRLAMGGLQREQFRVLFLNTRNRLIADEAQQTGTVDQAPVYPREILKRALDLGSTALVLVHNHPGGDPSPSRQDIEATRALQSAARPLGVTIQDHLVVSRYDFRSLRAMGHLG